jgi:molecular chaperone DnaK
LAYGLEKEGEEKIAVYDLGGGTFDISVLEIDEGFFEVLATDGDTQLGGDDWDNAIIKHIVDQFKSDNDIDLSGQPDALQRIKEEAEKAKIALSSSQSYELNLPFITADQSGPKHIQMSLSRSQLEQMTDHLFERTKGPVKACLKEAGVSSGDIDELVLVGGMTRMPKVVETAKALAGKDPHQGVNPDEVVAVGAAIQGGVLAKDPTLGDVVLLDVTPLTLSIETMGGVATPMIERNTTIPAKKSQVFSTAADNQPSVDIVVCQGERKLVTDNKMLGNFRLDGINGAPRGVPQIEVTFDIDRNGILKVSAKDKETGKEQNISIEGSSGLSDDEIEKAKQEAEKFADEDKDRMESIEVRNVADNAVYTVKKQIEELGDQLPEDAKTGIEASVAEVEEALKSDDTATIKEATDALQAKFAELAGAAQSAAGADPMAAAAAAAGSGAGGVDGDDAADEPKEAEGEVVDAEFEEVGEDKA